MWSIMQSDQMMWTEAPGNIYHDIPPPKVDKNNHQQEDTKPRESGTVYLFELLKLVPLVHLLIVLINICLPNYDPYEIIPNISFQGSTPFSENPLNTMPSNKAIYRIIKGLQVAICMKAFLSTKQEANTTKLVQSTEPVYIWNAHIESTWAHFILDLHIQMAILGAGMALNIRS